MTEHDEELCTERHPAVSLVQPQENGDMVTRSWWLADNENAEQFADFMTAKLGPPVMEAIQSQETYETAAEAFLGVGGLVTKPHEDEA